MENLVDIDEEGGQPKLSVNSTPYQTQECVLYGSIFTKHVPDLERRLAGLCDPGCEEFSEHEMAFSLRALSSATEMKTDIKLRRRFRCDHQLQNYWQLRYIGVPEPDQKCPTIVRKEISSLVHSQDMMTYAKALGLRMDYEYITQGKLWTKGNIKIVHAALTRTLRAGTYDSSSIKSMSDSTLVEISISLPESAEYMPILCLLLVSSTYALDTCRSNRDCGTFKICVPTGFIKVCVGISRRLSLARRNNDCILHSECPMGQKCIGASGSQPGQCQPSRQLAEYPF